MIVADSVAHQKDMTRRIVQSIAHVEEGTADTSSKMRMLSERAEQSRRGADVLSSTAQIVAQDVEALRLKVGKLIASVRAA